MKKLTKSVLAMLMMACMLFGLTACGGGGDTTPTPTPTQAVENPGTENPEATPVPTEPAEPKEIVTIKYGTHWVNGLDPHYTDEVTGEYVMAADQREARYAAEKAILDELGVVFEYVQFSGNTTEVLLQSVMANDPVCDIAVIWGGAEDDVLAQNVLQKLDDYAYIFEDPEYSWMFLDKLYGNHYFLTDVVRFNQRWPLVYNIDLIEEAGLENPSVTFANGNWTWSTFKDLLTKLDAFYANDDTISAYLTDHRFSVLSAIYTAGGAIYGNDGLSVTSDATKKGVAYIEELIDAELLTEQGVEFGNDNDPDWTANCEVFRTGGTCFTDHADWLIGWSGSTAAERGESIGIVPWPRPDDMPLDSEDYRQVITLGDSVAVLKGVDPEIVELALKAYALYTKTYYTTLAGVESMSEYKENYIEQQAVTFSIDIFHEEYGDAILESFAYITDQMENGSDYADMLGFRGDFDSIAGKSIYGVDGYASYDVSIEANLSVFSETEEEMKALLSSGKLNDTIAPVVTTLKEPVAVPAGTTMKDAIWSEYIQANDSIEGVISFDNFDPIFTSNDSTHTDSPIFDAKVDRVHSEEDLKTPGFYNRMFRAYFFDSFGNRGYKTISVIVYDPNNTEKPVVEAHTAPMFVSLGTDVNTIKWIGETPYNYAIKSAVDADGLDLSGNVRADLSTLDSSTQGTYDVKITVTDYVGNSTQVTVQVIVE